MATNLITANPPHTNRLADQKSPYLLQHAHNPVDWFPWGKEAFERARSENKPILLSIGYSTCHWCHVMERESFEAEEVAAVLNRHFVSIKVDREERPDVDKIYMTFVQAMTGQGGWPLNVFLTPDLKPFYGGTYFPPEPRHDRPSFTQLLEQVARVWETRNHDVLASAAELHSKLQEVPATGSDKAELQPEVLQSALSRFKREYDPRHGGFGRAPKFPHPSQPLFVLQQGIRQGDQEAVDMVLHTCTAMARGGIHDQIGGGFSRYSVDAKWLVPHFEKMLYDNAQLVNLYLDAWLVSGDAAHAETARDIIEYVLRDMTHRDGGFYSAEDADSEGKEGKFYCWTTDELKDLLSPAEFRVAVRYFGITREGNFVDHSDPDPLPNQNVLRIVDAVDADVGTDERLLLSSARRKMFEAREQRTRPHLDDKVLASWNGMMLGALARAGAVLRDAKYLAAAERNLEFLKDRLWDGNSGTLSHRWREGERDDAQLAEDYANVLSGVIDLYEAALNPAHLEFAIGLAESLIQRFFDDAEGGFWQSAGREDLIIRIKDDYDSAEPSANSVAALALLRLGVISERRNFQTAAEKTLRHFAARMRDLPQAFSHMLLALDFALNTTTRVAVVGDHGEAATRNLIHAAHSVYQPARVILGNAGAVAEFTRSLPVGERPAAYLCSGNTCQPPVSEPAQLRELLRKG